MKALPSSILYPRKPLPKAITPQCNLSLEENVLFQQWDEDVKRAATYNARLSGLDKDDACDLAQEARIKLLMGFRRRRIVDERYLRVLIKNSMLTSRGRLKRIRDAGREGRYEDHLAEGVTKNPFVFSVESEALARQEENDAPSEESSYHHAPMHVRKKDLPPPSSEPDLLAIAKIRKWIEKLPGNLRAIYEVLYVNGLPQRAAAAELNISQPRVAQLHQLLLIRGKKELANLVA